MVKYLYGGVVMNIIDIINKTKRKQELSETEIRWLVNAYTSDEIPDYQLSSWLMAVCLNGLTDAEDEAIGQIFDAILHVVAAQEEYRLTAKPNDATRGTVRIERNGDEVVVKAIAEGNARFVAWREGNQQLSTSVKYTFTLDHNTDLTAVFTPNTDIVTLIEGVEVKVPANNIFYDLQGRQVLVPRKGIYILNGKKVIVK